MLRVNRLRLYRHVEGKNKSDWVSACRELQVEGKFRGRKTWNENSCKGFVWSRMLLIIKISGGV